MKRKQYDIHKDFTKLSKTNPTINKFSAYIFQFFLRPLFNFQNSTKDCIVKKKSIILNGKKVRFLIYTPKNLKRPSPCLIYYHGGGFMLPAGSYQYNNAREYAISSNCKVIMPDYPLSPKNKYPIPTQICFEFYKYILNNSSIFDIDPTKIIVGGDSAGGNLASIVCMMASDNNIKIPLAQILIYPVVGITPPTPSMLQFDDTGMCNSKDFEKYCKLYLKNEIDKQSRYISLLNQEDLSKYPPTYIETTEFDCLRDEGIIFANMLKKANVEVYENHTKKTIHAYDMVQKSEITKQSLTKRIDFLILQFNKDKN